MYVVMNINVIMLRISAQAIDSILYVVSDIHTYSCIPHGCGFGDIQFYPPWVWVWGYTVLSPMGVY